MIHASSSPHPAVAQPRVDAPGVAPQAPDAAPATVFAMLLEIAFGATQSPVTQAQAADEAGTGAQATPIDVTSLAAPSLAALPLAAAPQLPASAPQLPASAPRPLPVDPSPLPEALESAAAPARAPSSQGDGQNAAALADRRPPRPAPASVLEAPPRAGARPALPEYAPAAAQGATALPDKPPALPSTASRTQARLPEVPEASAPRRPGIADEAKPAVAAPLVPAVAAQAPTPGATPLREELRAIEALDPAPGATPAHAASSPASPPLHRPQEVPQPPAAPALHPVTALVAPEFGEAFAARVSFAIQAGAESASIQVTPPELGPIAMQVSVTEGGAHVHFAAESALTREALADALPRLREMLATQGLELAGSSVGAELPRRETRAQSPGQAAPAPEHAAAEADAWRAAPRAESRLIDIFA